MRPRFLALFFPVFLACSREEKRPERTAPWPASASALAGSTAPAVRRARYEVDGKTSSVRFELPAKRANPSGRLLAPRGSFDVDLAHPDRTRGKLFFDLGLLQMEDRGAVVADTENGERALEWLELGNDVPEAVRQTHREATFSLEKLEASADRRLDGKQRALDFVATGELSLHGVRVAASVPIRLELEPAPDEGKAPTRLVIRSRRPLVVSLGVHDIRPRNARGVLVARELTLLGESVGREAKVSFVLELALRP